MNNPGCLRKILIGIILSVSLSSAIVYFTFTKGMYKGEPAEYTSIFIKNGTLFTGLDVEPSQQNILITKESISCLGADCEVPENARVIDANNLAVLPALTDLGVQFYRASGEDRNASSFEQFLSFTRQRPEVRKNFHRAGISTIRSIGDAPQNILVLRDQLASGKLAGPRLYASGLMISVEGGYPQVTDYQGNDFMLENGVQLIQGPNSISECMEKLQELEVDGLKLVYRSFDKQYPILEFEEMESLIKQGKKLNLWISVLTGSNQEIQEAIEAGAEILEFGTKEAIDSLSILKLVESQAIYLPMLSHLEEDEAALNLQSENVARIYQAGGRIGVASDNRAYQSFGKSLQRELELLVGAGIPAPEVLRMASFGAAMGLKTDDRFGSIEIGKWADIILTEGKPWENISDIKRVQYLIQDGKIVLEKGKIID